MAATLALGTFGLWAAPAGAAPETFEAGCQSGGLGAFWYPSWFWSNPIEGATIDGSLDSELVLTWNFPSSNWSSNFELYFEFHDAEFEDDDGEPYGCGGDPVHGDPDRAAPADICFAFSAGGDNGVAQDNTTPLRLEIKDDSYVESFPDEESEEFSLDMGETRSFGYTIESNGSSYPVEVWYFNIGFDDSQGSLSEPVDVTLTMTITRCGGSPTQGDSGSRMDLDFDLAPYLEIAAADTGDLPDTL